MGENSHGKGLDKVTYSVNNGDLMSGPKFRKLRKTLELRQDELARKLGISRVSVTRYENGTVEIPESRAIALRNLLKLKESAA